MSTCGTPPIALPRKIAAWLDDPTDRDLRVIADLDRRLAERLELGGDFDVDDVDLEARYPLVVDAEDAG